MLSSFRIKGLVLPLAAAFTLTSIGAAWAQDPPRKKKKEGSAAVTKALKKVDRQILSYSPDKAFELLTPVLEDKDPRVDATIGQIRALEQKYPEALEKLRSAAGRSDDPGIFVALGDTEAYAKNKGEADSAYQRAAQKAQAALAADPTDTDARFALGVAQQRLKSYGEATGNLTQALAEDASNPRIPFELGMTKLLQGDNQAAFDNLSRAIDSYSGYAYAYYYRALAADKIGRKDITVNDLDRFLALAPGAPEAEKARRILQAARG